MRSSVVRLLAGLLMIGSTLTYFSYAEAYAAPMPDTDRQSLKIGGDLSPVGTFNVSGLVPDANGRNSIRLVNDGDRTGQLGVSFSVINNTPGSIGEFADGTGDLGANLEIAVYIDVDGSGDWNSGDIGLRSNGDTYACPTALEYNAMDNYSDITWNSIESMTASTAQDFIIMWRIPFTVGNEIQDDSANLDISFFIVS
jgi:hypothetical protein